MVTNHQSPLSPAFSPSSGSCLASSPWQYSQPILHQPWQLRLWNWHQIVLMEWRLVRSCLHFRHTANFTIHSKLGTATKAKKLTLTTLSEMNRRSRTSTLVLFGSLDISYTWYITSPVLTAIIMTIKQTYRFFIGKWLLDACLCLAIQFQFPDKEHCAKKSLVLF